jgi:hypothetical protein
VAVSGSPPKNLPSTSPNTGSSGAAVMNSVMDERSLSASTPPKMSCAVLFVPATMAAHSLSRGPSSGWARYARASSSEAIA